MSSENIEELMSPPNSTSGLHLRKRRRLESSEKSLTPKSLTYSDRGMLFNSLSLSESIEEYESPKKSDNANIPYALENFIRRSAFSSKSKSLKNISESIEEYVSPKKGTSGSQNVKEIEDESEPNDIVEDNYEGSTPMDILSQDIQEFDSPKKELKILKKDCSDETVSCHETVFSCLKACNQVLTLRAVIYLVWAAINGSRKTLMRDSNDDFFVVEASSESPNFFEVLGPGKTILLNGLTYKSKISNFDCSSLFSILRLYGSSQIVCASFILDYASTWELSELLALPYEPAECPRKTITELHCLDPFTDNRVSVLCTVEKRSSSSVVLVDDEENRMKVDCLIPSSVADLLIPGKTLLVEYLRYFRETPSLDEFSVLRLLENCSDDNDGNEPDEVASNSSSVSPEVFLSHPV